MYSCFMGLQVMVRRCKGVGEARHKCGSPPDDIRGAKLGDQASSEGCSPGEHPSRLGGGMLSRFCVMSYRCARVSAYHGGAVGPHSAHFHGVGKRRGRQYHSSRPWHTKQGHAWLVARFSRPRFGDFPSIPSISPT